MPIKDSELILNQDGSVYHLNLKPADIADTVIFVGDQDRVAKISKHFDTIEIKKQKREFKTHTGTYRGIRLTVLSTGIGPDNIDIVMNELDALVNIDLKTRKIKKKLTSLNIIRIGTSGSLQSNIPVDTFVLSTHGMDLNGMLHFYDIDGITNPRLEKAFIEFTDWSTNKANPVVFENSEKLEELFDSSSVLKGLTATAGGFYGPQGRTLRLSLQDRFLNEKMDKFNFEGINITNYEMETAVIYGMSKLLGHHALSLNAIIANRPNKIFSKNPSLTIELLIIYCLNKLAN
ncbi:nucleoside phosphorylase [Flavobacteriaceae bacterium]|jgi:uridine phosphorylase|nr:nucleoside phosphorylase [Flavobacteriaceae bacterium]